MLNEITPVLTKMKASEYSLKETIKQINSIFTSHYQDNNNILIIQLNGIGDSILMTSLLPNFKDYNITVICNELATPLIKLDPNVEEVIPFPNTIKRFESVLEFCSKYVWHKSYTKAIATNYVNNPIAHFLCYCSGAKERIGYKCNVEKQYCKDITYKEHQYDPAWDNLLLTDIVINPYEIMSEKDRKLYLLKHLAIPIINTKTHLYLPDVEKKNQIVLGLSASEKVKEYPLNKWGKVIKKINIHNMDHNSNSSVQEQQFLLLGTNIEDSNYLVRKFNNVTNYIDKLDLVESAKIIKESTCYIGVDSCLAHIAIALNIPAIVLLCESEDKEEDHPGMFSSYTQFYKRHHLCIRPKHSLKPCSDKTIFQGCEYNVPHCITQIDPSTIVDKYLNL